MGPDLRRFSITLSSPVTHYCSVRWVGLPQASRYSASFRCNGRDIPN